MRVVCPSPHYPAGAAAVTIESSLWDRQRQEDEDRALEALRLAWGDAYDIGSERENWVATGRGGGRTVDGGTPDALNRAIRADWAEEAAR